MMNRTLTVTCGSSSLLVDYIYILLSISIAPHWTLEHQPVLYILYIVHIYIYVAIYVYSYLHIYTYTVHFRYP